MSEWQPIDTAPKDGRPVILADWDAMCLLSGAPHVWTARWVEGAGEWFECSHAALNDNGTATHWTELPEATGMINERVRAFNAAGRPAA